MRTVRIFALGALGLAVALLFPLIQDYAFFAMALSPLALLLIGQFYLPRSKRAVQVWFNPIVLDLDGEIVSAEPGMPVGRLSGKDLTYSFFKQSHHFEIATHRFWLLAGIGLFSLGGIWLAWWAEGNLFKGFAFFYLAGSIWVIVVSMALRWVWERRMLRLEGLSIAGFSVKSNSKPPYRQIRYHFVDAEGEYRGAIFDSMFCDQSDDMTIIFYNEADADQSIPASALMFHRLVWKDGN